jgi:hypothetical protein
LIIEINLNRKEKIMHISMKNERGKSSRILLLPALVAVLGLSACASAPQLPTNEIERAESAINRAEEARVADYASTDLRAAREKLANARNLMQQAVQEKDQDAATRARWLAEQSISDAELATAKAQEQRAKQVNKEMQNTIDMMQQEIQRDQ